MDKWGLIGLNGEQVLPCEYEYLVAPSCGLMCCWKEKGGKTGYVNVKGEFVIPAKFQQGMPFDRATGLAVVWETRDEVDLYGVIDRAGEYVVKPQHAGIRNPAEGLLLYKSYAHHGLFGYMDLRGTAVLSPRYKYAVPFSCGLALVTYPDDLERCYFIDRKGPHVLGPFGGEAREERTFSADGIARVCDPGKGRNVKDYYYINPAGQLLLRMPPKRGICEFRNGLAKAVDEKKKVGFVDISGEWAIPPKYDTAIGFIRGYAWVAVGGELKVTENDVEIAGRRWGLIDPQGREIVPLKYESDNHISLPSCGRLAFGEPSDGPGSPLHFGYRSTCTGKVVIPPKFAFPGEFAEGFAVVES